MTNTQALSPAAAAFIVALARRAARVDHAREQAAAAEAAAVAERLVGLKVDAVYTSPVERAQLTAAPTESALGLTPTIDDGLAEADTGDWTGLKLADLARKPEWRGLQAAPSTFRFPGGESFTELQARVLAALRLLSEMVGNTLGPGGRPVLIEHQEEGRAPFATKDGVTVARNLLGAAVASGGHRGDEHEQSDSTLSNGVVIDLHRSGTDPLNDRPHLPAVLPNMRKMLMTSLKFAILVITWLS